MHMNEVAQKKLNEVAVQVVAQGIADGKIPAATADFTALVKAFEAGVLALAEKFGTPEDAEPVAPTKAPGKRNEAKARTRKAPAVSEEDLGIIQRSVSLSPGKTPTELATLTGLGEATVRAALKALEASGAVVSATGVNQPGVRGPRPKVYSLA
jgi:ribosomal protein S25